VESTVYISSELTWGVALPIGSPEASEEFGEQQGDFCADFDAKAKGGWADDGAWRS
jgi:hypothetical protein